MSQRPVTLFTGQWADLPIAELLPKVKAMGYEGVDPPRARVGRR